MHITLETDYAIRIVDCLARNPSRMGAKIIAENADVTLRFSLKILRKLVSSGIVRSYKGAQGGYELAKDPQEITMNDVMEAIEGTYALSRCLRDGFPCSRFSSEGYCPYHYLFQHVSQQVQAQLKSVTFADLIQDDDTLKDMLK